MSHATASHLKGRLGLVVLAVALMMIVGCNSTDPNPDPEFRIRGKVSEDGAAPVPPLRVRLRTWPDSTGTGSMEVRTLTDENGGYGATFGTLPGGRADSLRVQMVQSDCENTQRLTDAMYRDFAVPTGEMTLADIGLSVVLPPAYLGAGRAACALIVSIEGELETWLAVWFDVLGDSIFGRWRVSHQASFGDAYGYFGGTLEGGQVVLDLDPVEPEVCPGLALTFGVHTGSNRLEPGFLDGNHTCLVPSAPVRFADGAYLSERLPAAERPIHPTGTLGSAQLLGAGPGARRSGPTAGWHW